MTPTPTGYNKHKLDKINYVVEFAMDMCDAPIQVYIRTLWPALLEALITWYALDLTQIFTAWARPHSALRGRRGGGHGKAKPKPTGPDRGPGHGKGGKRTWLKRWTAYIGFDPWDWLGRNLPFAEANAGRAVSPGVVTMWTIYDLGQRIMFWVMVYEVTEQFFYKWASGIANSYYCKEQYRPWCMCTSATDSNLGQLDYTPIMIETVVKARSTAWSAGNGIMVFGAGSSAHFKAKFTSPGIHPPAEPGRKLVIRHESGVQFESPDMTVVGGEVAVGGQATEAGMWYFFTTGPGTYLIAELEMTVVGSETFFDG